MLIMTRNQKPSYYKKIKDITNLGKTYTSNFLTLHTMVNNINNLDPTTSNPLPTLLTKIGNS